LDSIPLHEYKERNSVVIDLSRRRKEPEGQVPLRTSIGKKKFSPKKSKEIQNQLNLLNQKNMESLEQKRNSEHHE